MAEAPRLVVEHDGRQSIVRLRSAAGDTVLDVIAGEVSGRWAGQGRAGRTLFASWQLEDGRVRTAVSDDGGLRWGRVAELGRGLALRGHAAVRGATSSDDAVIVRLRTLARPAWREALMELGLTPRAFVPEHAYLCALERPGAIADAERLPFVAEVLALDPQLKLSDELARWLARADRLGAARRLVRIVEASHSRGRLLETLAALGARVPRPNARGRVLEAWLEAEALETLAREDAVLWLESWRPAELDVDIVREDAGVASVLDEAEWCGQGVRGEILDAGLDDSHPDLDGVLYHGPYDLHGHGTSVYGIVFGNGATDGDGEARARGLLSCAEQGIFADKDELTDRMAHSAELLEPPYHAFFQSNSWGHARTTSYDSYSFELDEIAWRVDLPILQSQSNSGDQRSRPEAWAKNVVSVGGIQHGNSLALGDDAWGGASTGPAEDGRVKPDLVYWSDHIYAATLGGYRPDFSGTSASTPQVAGVLGLILQLWEEGAYGAGGEGSSPWERRPASATARALLIDAAEDYPFEGPDHNLARARQGWGRPVAAAARARAARSFVVDRPEALQAGQVARYELDVAPGEGELAVTLVYPDPPGAPIATRHLVNDVDLRVITPSGAIYHGNHGLLEGSQSLEGGEPDRTNPVELVRLVDPAPGEWLVEVELVELAEDGVPETPEPDVSFALVVTGAAGRAVCEGGDPPPAPEATTPEDHRVSLSWDAEPEATRYRIYRSSESCETGWMRHAETAATSWDDEAVSGGAALHYRVRAINACGGISPLSECSSATPAGPCLPGPSFVGIESAVDLGEEECGVALTWQPAGAACGGSLVYDVYRSTTPGFEPGPETLLEACLPGPSYVDRTAEDGRRVYYVVRAEELGGSGSGPCGGAQETNRRERGATPSGSERQVYAESFDDASGGWQLEGEWEIGAPGGLGASLVGGPDPGAAFEGVGVLGLDLTGLGDYSGSYEANVREMALSPSIALGTHSALHLRYRRWLGVDERSEDQAWLEIETDAGWEMLWQNPIVPLSDKSWALEVHDLSAHLAGRSETRLRFGVETGPFRHHSGWNIDALELYEPRRCQNHGGVLPAVPDGARVPGAPMRAARAEGEDVDVSWDVQRCGAPAYHLLYGDAASLPSLDFTGARCALPASGEAHVELPAPAPGELVWWLIMAADGTRAGAPGYDGSGRLRDASGLGYCSIDERAPQGCPTP